MAFIVFSIIINKYQLNLDEIGERKDDWTTS